ncbi:DUF6701 domain-containing protein [Pseudoteredinibacter isoporae]|uniref:MSHA biogenesis protein MshQ n=1 Tax=Pseudoteredinibacter isoporae TaxID=570281 RepID=A0A7X0JU63_9GAMM|nr:DUF6701 domain-containing protein [Pseudoteredinibacter isoporae]MBB6522350.1 MSHA biogenesis protein MshQ [Pseudoteredinibacter isoporae]NHO87883.1 hypothetical protein [Pseudoteredinibacter isoporae]NIB23786.1 hypothetical protein [Pseudoteredinibacter isoporae]
MRIARESSMTLPFEVPSGARELTVNFWMRVGHDDFSHSPEENAKFVFTWLNHLGETEEVILHSGAEGAGDILRPSIRLPAGQYQSPNAQISLYTIDAVGRYNIDSFFIEASIGPSGFSIEPEQTNASVCEPNRITISMLDADGNVINDFEGIIDISTSTSHGNWSMVSPNGRLTAGWPDIGRASYQFEASDQGRVELLLSNEHAETLTVRVDERDGPTRLVSQSIRYAENTFVLAYPENHKRDVIAYRGHEITLSVVKRDEISGECGIAESYQADDVELRLAMQSGDTMAKTPVFIIDGQSYEIGSAFQNVPVTFTNGVAQFQLFTRDVGRFTLSARDQSKAFSSETLLGDSGDLLSRPFALWLNIPENPAALSHSGEVFNAAGSDFHLQAAAVGWQASDDLDNDGVADGHAVPGSRTRAYLGDNALLHSFSKEGHPASVQLKAQSMIPLIVSHHDLTGDVILEDFENGYLSSANIRYSNIGVMEIEAHIYGGSYLGADSVTTNKIQGRSGAIGRFIPSYFSISETEVIPACPDAGFSHLNQDFSVKANLRAMNAQGRVLDVYEGSFAKLDDEHRGQVNFQAAGLPGRLLKDTETLVFNQGHAPYRGVLRLQRSAAPDGPWRDVQLGINIQDDDGVGIKPSQLNLDLDTDNGSDYDHFLLGISDFYFSRLNLPDAHGPENRDLFSQLQIESWQGNSFQLNHKDSCSQLARGDIQYVQSGALSIDSNRTVSVGAGNSTASFRSLEQAFVNFVGGDAGQVFSAPGLGNRGLVEVDIDLANYPWLQFDWNQDGEYSDSRLPRAHFRFGATRGHDRVVYWRESLP